jgi:hypothetical protein
MNAYVLRVNNTLLLHAGSLTDKTLENFNKNLFPGRA